MPKNVIIDENKVFGHTSVGQKHERVVTEAYCLELIEEILKPLHAYAQRVDPAGQWGQDIIQWAVKRLDEGDEVRHLRHTNPKSERFNTEPESSEQSLSTHYSG